MRYSAVIIALFCFFVLGTMVALAEPGLIYGKIYTYDDEVLEGFIRWDRNEASWEDVLDGDKQLDRRHRKKYRKYRDDDDRRYGYDTGGIRIFGVNIFGGGYFGQASSGIRFGHVKTIIPDGDDEVILVLKSGEEIELENGSGDIGDDIREILIDTEDEGIIELEWYDIDKVELMETPNRKTSFGNRLYGTLVTRRGDEYTGYVCWDMDETYDTDIIDGQERSRKRKVKIKDIKIIERGSSKSALLTLKNGKKIRLEGSNDVDDSNRGIVLSDANLGRIVVEWDDFDYLEFKKSPGGTHYSEFDGGKKISGTVITEDGDKYSGFIQWDADEEYSWEFLDGKMDDVDFAVEFSNIKSIEKASRRGSKVILRDGRILRLRESNDVDHDNKGIIILSDDGDDGDDEVYVDWEDFEMAEFD